MAATEQNTSVMVLVVAVVDVTDEEVVDAVVAVVVSVAMIASHECRGQTEARRLRMGGMLQWLRMQCCWGGR